MKKHTVLILLVVLSVLFVGCSSKETKESNVTMDDFIKAYTDQGIEVNKEDKPIFSLIQAKDGVIFYVENSKTAIYEYASEDELNEATKDNALTKDWAKNGRFLLESKNEKANEIFKNVK
ncbi:hypothetical protein [Paenibacillus agilis]|uniref:Uncharacterized protein n=1 Tax=Paenibacillus agilis TaxID=3020863 RepID=A0A559J3A6_9BACL|nr:hypothetical protein [Paenibacillus agilis]TVX94364.1 hypothetical protein FPZ44_15665 [Paenibacillus agilis]